jgi:inner membrane protein
MNEGQGESMKATNGIGITPPPLPAKGCLTGVGRRHATTVKMAAVLVIALLLLIPLGLIQSVLSERLARRNEAITNIASTWGAEQTIVGPVLVVPYRCSPRSGDELVKDGRSEKGQAAAGGIAKAYFLPAELKISGVLDPNVLHRGIYEAAVYRGAIDIRGAFAKPSFDEWRVKPEDVLWDEAVIAVAVTDLRGTSGSLVLTCGGKTIPMKPGAKVPGMSAGVYAPVGGNPFSADTLSFELPLTINGSRTLGIAPVGIDNEVKITSSWADPSFSGAFLPVERKVGKDGFEALWKMTYYGRAYPPQWSSQDGAAPMNDRTVRESLLGVDLITAVDSYRYVERSIKYGVLFVALVFGAFFLFEVLASLRVHPFQYTVIGVALCLFYLALMSLSEVMPFGGAYLTGAVAAALMVTLYSAAVLRSIRRALVVAVELGVIYGLLYVILCRQDYSLLFGTVGLFLALSVVMYATRNIDWYARDGK